MLSFITTIFLLYHLIYISKTRLDWSQQQLIQLLNTSWSNNKKKNISGMLVYLGDRFVQLLEGEKEDVLNTFQNIQLDPRHKEISVLLEGTSENRIFSNWSMGFKSVDYEEFENITGFRDPAAYFSDDNINNHSHPAVIFLKLFYDKNYRDFTDLTTI